MRVLFLTADVPPHVHSGVGTAVGYSAEALASAGCPLEILTTAPHGKLYAAYGRVPVIQLNTSHFPAHLRRCEILHLHSLRLAGLAAELRRRDSSTLVYTAHTVLDHELGTHSSTHNWRALQNELFRTADGVLFLSEVERSLTLARFPRLRSRSAVVANAIAPATLLPEPSAETPTVLFAGRFCASKGLDVAVAAMERLLHQHPGLRCILAGAAHGETAGESSGEAAVAALAARFPGRCDAPGWLSRDGVDTLLQRASVLLVPSRYEPFGMIVLEALRLGVPVLAADLPGLRDLLPAHSGGLLIADHDPRTWADGVIALLNDPARLAALRALGPPYVAGRFKLAAHAQQLLAFYLEASGARSSAFNPLPPPSTYHSGVSPCG